MKHSLAIAIGTAALLAAGMPLAQTMKAPTAAPNAAAMPSGSSTKMDAPMGQMDHMAQMDEHMKKMQALHERIASAATPEERQKVMDEQRQEMQDCMVVMKPMMQGGGMMGGMGGAMAGQKAKRADMPAHMQMMQKRMDMMQMMMQTMIDQQVMMAGAKVADAAPRK